MTKKTAIRCTANAEYNAHPSLHFKNYHLLKFKEIFEYVLYTHMYVCE